MEIRLLENNERDSILTLLNSEFSSLTKIQNTCFNEHVFSVGVFDQGRLVGHIFVHEMYQYLEEKKFYTLEYVVVDKAYRGQGIAKRMLEFVENIAIERKIDYLTLTSRSSRVAARGLYVEFGFSCKETGIFTKPVKER